MTLERWGLSERYHETSKDFTFHAVKNRQAPGREIYVLVIGEASRADSWSLFGYDRETTPRLEKREGVVPFSNVLTQSNATHKSVPIILSPASAANYDSIYVQNEPDHRFQGGRIPDLVPVEPGTRTRSLIDFFSEEAERPASIFLRAKGNCIPITVPTARCCRVSARSSNRATATC